MMKRWTGQQMEKGAVRNYVYEDLCKLDASYKFGDKVGFL